ncbi:MAG TPA: transketolase [Candidatus Limnocylindrales bacterium]|nr:transketolase [Candidatus Limnocylindrales bacterium]
MNPINENMPQVKPNPPPPELVHSLRLKARQIRRNVLLMAKGKGEGYVGQGLGAADILTVLYFYEMRFDPHRLDWPDRDRFLLSTGHYSIVLFATLTELGVFPPEELSSYGADGSRFEMSACETTPGVEITGGSLGHGLSQAVGMALGSRLSGRKFRVFNFLSDGELQEGATWEAAMAAAHYKLDNLIALVDINNMQADGKTSDVMMVEPVVDKWKAFGWHTQSIDGNSLEELLIAFQTARSIQNQPKVILCYTLMGKGVPLIEQKPKAHFIRVEPHEWDLALRQLEESKV